MFYQTSVIVFIGQDAELRSNNGENFVAFSGANTRKSKGQEVTTWISFATKKEELLPYLKKGTQVLIQGTQRVKAYIDKNNEPQASIEIFASTIELLSSKKEVEQSV